MTVVVRVLEMLAQHRRSAAPDLVTTERIPIVMDEAGASIEAALERHGEDLGWFLERTVRTLGDRWPWAWIFFRDCYPLAGHVRSIRRDAASMPFSTYGREPDPIPLGWTPCVGVVMPMTKDVLCEAAQRSPMFESARLALEDCSADGHWACLSDPLDPEWVEGLRD